MWRYGVNNYHIAMWLYLGKTTGQWDNQLSRMRGNTRSRTKTLMEIKKKEHVLLVDEASDWLQNLDGGIFTRRKRLKKNANRLVLVTYA